MIGKSCQGVRSLWQHATGGIGKAVLCAALLMGCGSVLQARGQAVYGSVYGTVADKSGAVIPNATITVTDVAKGTSATW